MRPSADGWKRGWRIVDVSRPYIAHAIPVSDSHLLDAAIEYDVMISQEAVHGWYRSHLGNLEWTTVYPDWHSFVSPIYTLPRNARIYHSWQDVVFAMEPVIETLWGPL